MMEFLRVSYIAFFIEIQIAWAEIIMQEHFAEISYLFGPVKFAIKQIRNAYAHLSTICKLSDFNTEYLLP